MNSTQQDSNSIAERIDQHMAKGDEFSRTALLPDALREYSIALHLSNEYILSPDKQARILSRLAATYGRQGLFEQALEYNNKALAILEQQDYLHQYAALYHVLLGNSANIHSGMNDIPAAMELLHKATSIAEQLNDRASIVRNLGNLGILYTDIGDTDSALTVLQRAIYLAEELQSDPHQIVALTVSLATVYYQMHELDSSVFQLNRAINLAVQCGANDYLSSAYTNLSKILMEQQDLNSALETLLKALALMEDIGKLNGKLVCLINIIECCTKLKNYQIANEYITIANKLAIQLEIPEHTVDLCVVKADLYMIENTPYYNPELACIELENALEISKRIGIELTHYTIYQTLAALYVQSDNYQRAYQNMEKYARLREQQFQLDVAERVRHSSYETKIAVEKERTRERERILFKTLPENIAQRLLDNDLMIADYHQAISVLFMDIVNFTEIAGRVNPKILLHMLNIVFTKADEITEHFGMEKIKTIGDAYMAVCGAPTPRADHAWCTIQAAIMMLKEINGMQINIPEHIAQPDNHQLQTVQIRIGVHCGPAIGGVIGREKLAYDLWGDTINIASRMESHGKPGSIHCTDIFRQNVQEYMLQMNYTPEYTFISRGDIMIKGKGTMRTSFIEILEHNNV
jgi:class 3 adenylate cyclase